MSTFVKKNVIMDADAMRRATFKVHGGEPGRLGFRGGFRDGGFGRRGNLRVRLRFRAGLRRGGGHRLPATKKFPRPSHNSRGKVCYGSGVKGQGAQASSTVFIFGRERCTLPLRRQRVHTFMRLFAPFTTTCTLCTLGAQVVWVLRLEWLTLLPFRSRNTYPCESTSLLEYTHIKACLLDHAGREITSAFCTFSEKSPGKSARGRARGPFRRTSAPAPRTFRG